MGAAWIGEGSIRQVENGRHRGKWRLQWTVVEGGEERKVDRLFPRKGDAIAWRDERKVELKTGARTQAVKSRSAATVQAVFDAFAGTKEAMHADGLWVQDGVKPLTVYTRLCRWNKWVSGRPIARLPIHALNRAEARSFVQAMKAEGAPIQTVEDTVAVLKVLVNSAIVERKDCADLVNPFLRLPLEGNAERAARLHAQAERTAAEGPSLVTIAPKDAMDGLDEARTPRLRALLAVHLLAGLRLGEQMALCVEQIDFERGVLVVDRAVHLDPGGGQRVGLPKGNKVRLVAMCPTLATILRDHVGSLPQGRAHLFGADRADKPRMKDKAYALWKSALAEAKLSEDLVPKGCRVSHNNWIEKLTGGRVSPSTRLEHMGHSLAGEEGQPAGMAVNLVNYTAHVPEAYAILRKEIERAISRGRRPPGSASR